MRIEQAVKEAIRNGPGLRVCLAVILPAAVVCAYFIPQLLTGTSSYQDARASCRDLTIARIIESTSERYKDVVDLESAEDFFEKNALGDLHPSHVFSVVSTVISLACFIAWIFFTPHRSAASLDQKRTPRPNSYRFYKPRPLLSHIESDPPSLSISLFLSLSPPSD